MKISITKRLRDQMLKLSGKEFWERLADITEHPPEWLRAKANNKEHLVRFELVSETPEVMKEHAYGEVLA
jgi:hypothetical protein